jgi:pimeloyl-ACP methyl ester carboxylesterase
LVYARFFRELKCIACLLMLGTACSSDDEGTGENPITTGGVGGASMVTGGASGTDASGGSGGASAGAGGVAGMTTTSGGTGGGESGAGGNAGESGAGAGGDSGTGGMTGGMGGEAGSEPGEVEPNPDGTDPLPPLPDELALPIIFVHGFAGSAQQYESQAQRFVANGYPADRILGFDHDGSAFNIAAYADGVDAVIDQALEDFGVEKVYLVGHSRGTYVGADYVGDPARAAKVAKYISLDGVGCAGVTIPCLEPNQDMIPGQAHVEIATSRESFAMQYEFLLGMEPEVLDIVAQKAPVVLNGRAVRFPANTGRANTTLEVWEIDSATGHRAGDMPIATFPITEDGGWGPVTVDSRKRYEFAIVPNGGGSVHHLYMQSFLRDSNFVRLLSGDPDSPTRMNTNTSDAHSALIAMRMREWYATDVNDATGDQTDALNIGVKSASAGDIAPLNALQRFVGVDTIGVHIHDAAASPGDSMLSSLAYFSGQPFQSGVDLFMPATEPPDGTITITNIPRGDATKPQVLNVPNWASSGHTITLLFADYAH